MLRIPLSLYSGWLVCATALQTMYLLASWGMTDKPKEDKGKNGGRSWWHGLDFMMWEGQDEGRWTAFVLETLSVVVGAVAWWERNPMWGNVFGYAVAAIESNL